jgi:hypothetical protein
MNTTSSYQEYIGFIKKWISRAVIFLVCVISIACSSTPKKDSSIQETDSTSPTSESKEVKPTFDDLRGFLYPKNGE